MKNPRQTLSFKVSKLSLAYRYYGLIFGRLKIQVSLRSAEFQTLNDGSHVAVWLGVNSPHIKSWVQGGIEMESFDSQPQVYLEMEDANYKIQTFKWQFNKPIIVELKRNNGYWTATAHGHVSRPVKIFKPPYIDATMEIFGDAKATGTIGRKVVRSK